MSTDEQDVILTINSFGGEAFELSEATREHKSIQELWALSSENFRKNFIVPALKNFGEYADTDSIILGLTISPVLVLRNRGVSEEEILSLEAWQYVPFSDSTKSIAELLEICNRCELNEETDSITVRDAIRGVNSELLRGLGQELYDTYIRLLKKDKLPPWVQSAEDVLTVMYLVTHFKFSENLDYLNNLRNLTREDATYLKKLGQGDAFACLCLKSLWAQQHQIVSIRNSLSCLLSGTIKCERLQWIRIERVEWCVTIPIYSYYSNKEYIESILHLATRSEVFVWGEGNQLVVRILREDGRYQHNDLRPVTVTNEFDLGDDDPVTSVCKGILSEFCIKNNFSDRELQTEVYFIFAEIAAGHEDWLRIFKTSLFSTVFPFYNRGDSLACSLWRLLSKFLHLDYELKRTPHLQGEIVIKDKTFSIYAALEEIDELVAAVKSCEDKNSIIVR